MSMIDEPRLEVEVVKDQKARAVLEGSKRWFSSASRRVINFLDWPKEFLS